MSKYREAYTALNASSPRSEVSAVLLSIITASSRDIKDQARADLVQTIIDDLASLAKGSSGSKQNRLTTKDASRALLAVKMLGKEPSGSEVIATRANFSALLSVFNTLRDDVEASNEALRCLANALLLIPDGRMTFVQKEVGGGDAIVDLLEKSTSAERIFLASRILFLATVTQGDFIRNLVESKPPGKDGNIIEIISSKLDLLTSSILSSEKMAREAMSDLLKMAFNLLLHYPKMVDTTSEYPEGQRVMGDCWSDKLDGILTPLLRLFNTLPPTFPAPLSPPMTQVIHALITIPVTPTLRVKWFPVLSNPGSPRQQSKPVTPTGSPPLPDSPNASTSRSESPGGKDSREMKAGAFDRAFARLSVARRPSSHRSTSPNSLSNLDTLLRAYDLLDVTMAHNLPGKIDPDDPSVRERCRSESDCDLDDLMSPLVILLTKLVNADEGARKRMREWILPDDLDRTSPLEERADLLGRCLRLLSCIHHPRLKDAVGEMLYAVCDSDGTTLSSYVGYGNVAGFLFNKGILSAPPPRPGGAGAPETTTDGTPINPITGIAQRNDPLPQMTDEEKEREAEKLFVLFDRLERSGAIDPNQNPIRKAIAGGKGPAY